ncbi:MAG TPA: type IV toxin-antitoxin system AbiEi family antitoxin [Anaerolineales bacterium]|nr:type IV toxin-antitoxin system AbiEi family antitoxin [Anaerolineales bacterium]
MAQIRDRDLLDAALERLIKWGVTAEIAEPEPTRLQVGVDARVRIRHGGREEVFTVEIKRGLRRETLGGLLLQLERLGQNALLVADYITPPLAEELKARGVQFMDTAGNAYIDRPPLLIWIKGERPLTRVGGPLETGRAFTPSGLQVLFALLCHPDTVDRPYREIARWAGVAHGTVGWVMAEMPKMGYVAMVGGKRRLLNPERLLQQWVAAYARTLRPKLLLGRYRAERLDWWETMEPLHYGFVLGGEAAAARLTKILRPGTLTFYGPKLEPRLLLAQRLRPDPAGNVEFLRRFWTFEDKVPGMAPAVLVYADLVTIGDARTLEAAKQLQEDIRARLGQ